MKRYQEIMRTEKYVALKWCDFCGKEIKQEQGIADEVTVRCTTGQYDRDGGGDTTTVEFDVCVRCFDTRIGALFPLDIVARSTTRNEF